MRNINVHAHTFDMVYCKLACVRYSACTIFIVSTCKLKKNCTVANSVCCSSGRAMLAITGVAWHDRKEPDTRVWWFFGAAQRLVAVSTLLTHSF